MSEKPVGTTVLLGRAADLESNAPSLVKKVDHIKRVRGGRGYLLNDNRASGGVLEECSTLTCIHCNSVVILNPLRQRERGFCRKCNAYVCDTVGCNAECNPMEQMVMLAHRYPDQAWLPRTKDGRTLFDPKLKERHKVY